MLKHGWIDVKVGRCVRYHMIQRQISMQKVNNVLWVENRKRKFQYSFTAPVMMRVKAFFHSSSSSSSSSPCCSISIINIDLMSPLNKLFGGTVGCWRKWVVVVEKRVKGKTGEWKCNERKPQNYIRYTFATHHTLGLSAPE